MLGSVKAVSLVLALEVIAGGTFLFSTQNTTADDQAAYKTDMILGRSVTGIVFDLNDSDPTLIDAITFKVAPGIGSTQANYVAIQTEKGGTWTECSLAGEVATCTFESLIVDNVTALDIVAK
ncbi:MAG: hypothetical protein ACM33V_02620 [Chloroflexota bacterium]|nr:hypothetical protein [Anaerolineales bacterium]